MDAFSIYTHGSTHHRHVIAYAQTIRFLEVHSLPSLVFEICIHSATGTGTPVKAVYIADLLWAK